MPSRYPPAVISRVHACHRDSGRFSPACAAYPSMLAQLFTSCCLDLGQNPCLGISDMAPLCGFRHFVPQKQTRLPDRPKQQREPGTGLPRASSPLACLLLVLLEHLRRWPWGKFNLVIHFRCSSTQDSRFADASEWDGLSMLQEQIACYIQGHTLLLNRGLLFLSVWRN